MGNRDVRGREKKKPKKKEIKQTGTPSRLFKEYKPPVPTPALPPPENQKP